MAFYKVILNKARGVALLEMGDSLMSTFSDWEM